MQDLIRASNDIFSNKKGKKGKHAADSEEDVHDPIEVVVDILLSFLAKSSASFRSVASHVFGALSGLLSLSSLALLLEVLTESADGASKMGVDDVSNEDVEGSGEEMDESSDADDDGSADEGGDADDNNDEDGDEEEDDDDDDDDDSADESGSEAVDEDLRDRLAEALGVPGTESVDKPHSHEGAVGRSFTLQLSEKIWGSFAFSVRMDVPALLSPWISPWLRRVQ